MKLLYALGQFLISEWIWSVTLAQQQVVIACVLLVCTYIYMRIGLLRSLAYACIGQIGAWGVLSFIAIACMHGWFAMGYDSTHPAIAVHPFVASLLLGAIYALEQIVVLHSMRYHLPRSWQSMSWAILGCNLIAAYAVYLFLPPW